MTVQEILQIARERDIDLIPAGDRLRYRYPEGALDDDFLQELRRHKQEILTALRPRVFDGHTVARVIWGTPNMAIFADEQGQLWRYLPSWGKAWPVTGSETIH